MLFATFWSWNLSFCMLLGFAQHFKARAFHFADYLQHICNNIWKLEPSILRASCTLLGAGTFDFA
jgi:hypothetical protein